MHFVLWRDALAGMVRLLAGAFITPALNTSSQSVGEGVTSVKVGDAVIPCYTPECKQSDCIFCEVCNAGYSLVPGVQT